MASSIRRRNLQYDVAVDQRKLRRIEEVFPDALVRATLADSGSSSRFIFIVGLPRSGTTPVPSTSCWDWKVLDRTARPRISRAP